jgi:thiamine biosynthesis lipoprotein
MRLASLLLVGVLTSCVASRTLAAAPAAAPKSASADTSVDSSEPQRRRYEQVEMGMPFAILLYSADTEAANRAAAAAFARIGELNRIMSDYDPSSELSRLSDTAGQGKAVHVSDDLWIVLSRAQKLSAETEGAFDVTVGPYVKLWRRARRTKAMPSPERLAAARASVGYQALRLDLQAQTAELRKPGMRLDLGGIAAGYAIDEAMKVLAEHKIKQVLIDGSGDIVVGDPPPGKEGWRIELPSGEAKGPDGKRATAREAPPSRYLLLRNCSVTTAGDDFQFVELDGKRYSHIVDPRTGLGMTDHSSVIIVAPDCLTADSLDTAVSVLGPKRGLALVEKYRGASALIMQRQGDRIESTESPAFSKYVVEEKP